MTLPEPRYRIVHERDDGGLSVTSPAPRWLMECMAEHGCTEREAMAMLAMKLHDRGQMPHPHDNRLRTALMTVDELPETRDFRNAWRFDDAKDIHILS